tara:strand:+ start:3209 stop:3778 length:570 start_codon:yes stop_codon:yes gene_type:complete
MKSISRYYVPSHGETAEKLVSQRLALRNRAQTTVVHLFRVELNSAFGETESALHERGELANAATLFPEHVSRARGADDDLCLHRRNADLNARVSVFRELTDEHFVEFGEEHAIGDELLTVTKTHARHYRQSLILTSTLLGLCVHHNIRVDRAHRRPSPTLVRRKKTNDDDFSTHFPSFPTSKDRRARAR